MRLDIANYGIKIAQAGFFVKEIFSAKMRIHKNFKKFLLDFFACKVLY